MTEPATPSITSITAIRIAIDVAGPLTTGTGLQPIAVDGGDNGTVKFRLLRYIGDCPVEHSVEMSRAMDVHDFEDAARRAWIFLKLEHQRCKPQWSESA